MGSSLQALGVLRVSRPPERAGSVVVNGVLSCPAACGILVPQPEMEPMSPALEGRFLTTGPCGKSPSFSLVLKTASYNRHYYPRVMCGKMEAQRQ